MHSGCILIHPKYFGAHNVNANKCIVIIVIPEVPVYLKLYKLSVTTSWRRNMQWEYFHCVIRTFNLFTGFLSTCTYDNSVLTAPCWISVGRSKQRSCNYVNIHTEKCLYRITSIQFHASVPFLRPTRTRHSASSIPSISSFQHLNVGEGACVYSISCGYTSW